MDSCKMCIYAAFVDPEGYCPKTNTQGDQPHCKYFEEWEKPRLQGKFWEEEAKNQARKAVQWEKLFYESSRLSQNDPKVDECLEKFWRVYDVSVVFNKCKFCQVYPTCPIRNDYLGDDRC